MHVFWFIHACHVSFLPNTCTKSFRVQMPLPVPPLLSHMYPEDGDTSAPDQNTDKQ